MYLFILFYFILFYFIFIIAFCLLDFNVVYFFVFHNKIILMTTMSKIMMNMSSIIIFS